MLLFGARCSLLVAHLIAAWASIACFQNTWDNSVCHHQHEHGIPHLGGLALCILPACHQAPRAGTFGRAPRQAASGIQPLQVTTFNNGYGNMMSFSGPVVLLDVNAHAVLCQIFQLLDCAFAIRCDVVVFIITLIQ